MDEGQKGHCQFVVSRGETPEMLDASEVAFDQVEVFVEMAVEMALGESTGTDRDGGLCWQVFDGLGSAFDVGNLPCLEDHLQQIVQEAVRLSSVACQNRELRVAVNHRQTRRISVSTPFDGRVVSRAR